MRFLVSEFVIHFFIGAGFMIMAFLFFRRRRRPIFRFGGDDPISFGSKSRWLLWYTLAYIFEVFTSYHPGMGSRFYLELALSAYQAVALTLGLFVLDRISMMFEPESHWRAKLREPKAPKAPKAAVTVPAAAPEVPTLAPMPAAPAPPVAEIPSTESDDSWLTRNVRGAAGKVGSVPSGIFGKIRAAARQSRETARGNRDERRAAKKAQDEETRAGRQKKLEDLLKGH